MSPADTALQHAAAPDRDIAGEAESLDFSGAGVAADAAHLDVDDARGAEVQSSFSIADVADRLVEAQGGLQMPLKFCMIGDVIPPERLLHHQEVKFVETLQMFQFCEGVSRIGIYGQKNAGVNIADGAHNFEIFARFDLKFDALITGAKLNFDSFKKHLGSGFEP